MAVVRASQSGMQKTHYVSHSCWPESQNLRCDTSHLVRARPRPVLCLSSKLHCNEGAKKCKPCHLQKRSILQRLRSVVFATVDAIAQVIPARDCDRTYMSGRPRRINRAEAVGDHGLGGDIGHGSSDWLVLKQTNSWGRSCLLGVLVPHTLSSMLLVEGRASMSKSQNHSTGITSQPTDARIAGHSSCLSRNSGNCNSLDLLSSSLDSFT
jgi:hypothetical protein